MVAESGGLPTMIHLSIYTRRLEHHRHYCWAGHGRGGSSRCGQRMQSQPGTRSNGLDGGQSPDSRDVGRVDFSSSCIFPDNHRLGLDGSLFVAKSVWENHLKFVHDLTYCWSRHSHLDSCRKEIAGLGQGVRLNKMLNSDGKIIYPVDKVKLATARQGVD